MEKLRLKDFDLTNIIRIYPNKTLKAILPQASKTYKSSNGLRDFAIYELDGFEIAVGSTYGKRLPQKVDSLINKQSRILEPLEYKKWFCELLQNCI